MTPLAPRPRIFVALIVLFTLLGGLGFRGATAAPQAAGDPYPYRPGEILIKFRPGTTRADIDAIRADLGATRIRDFHQIGASYERITRLDVQQAVTRYRGDRRVQFIEPNHVLQALETPNDPMFVQLWGLNNTGQTGGKPGADIHATMAWDIFTGSANVLVAIIDTGVDYNHPDLATNIFVNPGETAGNGLDDDGNGFIDDVHGWDFVNNDNDPIDDHGHGTHVSGTVGAIGNNGVGVVGVSWAVRLLPIKFLSADGFGSTAGAISSIEYATQMGVRVMSNSWGGGPFSQAMYNAIQAAGQSGILFVAAAGNSGSNNDVSPAYPASYDLPNIISVAASNPSDNLASFSNYGVSSVDLAAPGTDILSTLPGGNYGSFSGTSMATPHVSGALALIIGRYPAIDAAGARSVLLARVDAVPALAGKVASGGRLNAFLPLAEPDSLDPAAIADLAVAQINGSWAELQWTATGDDDATGKASRYDVRYSTAPITEVNFDSATPAPGAPDPLVAGSAQQMRIDGLDFSTTYHFALKAFDELGNASGISNDASGSTLGPPDVGAAPESLTADLLTGQKTTHVLTISNTGVSELGFEISVQPVPSGTSIAPAAIATPAASQRAPPASAVEAGALPVSGRRYDEGRSPARAPMVSPARSTPARSAASGLRILLLQSGSDVSEIRGLLASFPDIAQVDVFDGGAATPTPEYLSTYNTVIAIANVPFGDQVTTGNVLADYVDAGGGLVLTLATFINGWEIGGRLLTDHYYPFELGYGPAGYSSLGAFDPSHPIMNGVAAAGGDLLGQVTLAAGAQLVASWSNGFPFVATRGTRVAAVNVFFGAPGYWSGDLPLLMHNAAFWAAGNPDFLDAVPRTGVVPPGGSVEVQVSFDAEGLNGGDYRANLVIKTNDPDEATVLVPTHLHVTGAPDIAVSPADLEYGQVFIGSSRAESLIVRNKGTDLLRISGVSVTPSDYSAPSAGFDLQPGEKRVLLVNFSPQSAAAIQGALEIASEDPDEALVTVMLNGQGVIPPDIVVEPGSLSVALLTGETTTRPLTIRNTGGSNLVFNVSQARAAAGPAPASAAIPSSVSLGAAVPAGTGSQAHDGVSAGRALPPAAWLPPPGPGSFPDRAATASPRSGSGAGNAPLRQNAILAGNDILVIASTSVATSLGRALDELGRGYDVVFTTDFTGIDFTPYHTIVVGMDGGYIEAASCQALANAAAGGRLLFMAGGTSYGPFSDGVQSYLLSHTGDVGWTISPPPHLSVVSPSDPLATGLPSTYVFQNSEASYYMLRINDPVAPVALKNGNDHPALVHKRIGSGQLVYFINSPFEYYWGDPGDFAILKQIVKNALALGPVSWLSVEPATGTIPPGEEVTLTIQFDAAGLNGGDYNADIHVASNDPDEPVVDVPAHLHVTGAPDIALSETGLDYGPVFIGVSKPETVLVSNAGTDLLTVGGVTAAPGDFTVPAGGFSLTPGQTHELIVTFTPSGSGLFQGSLEIQSDDPDEGLVTVALRGEGVVPPDIGVTPPALSVDLFNGEQTTRLLELANSGGSSLSFSLSIHPAPAPLAGAGAVTGAPLPNRTGPGDARQDGRGLAPPSGPSGLRPLLQHRLATLGSQSVVFYDDMEHGDNGWTRQVYGVDDLWHRSTRASNSPVTSWWCGLESTGDYSTGNRIRTAAVSPSLNLAGYSAPVTLEFYESFETEPGYDFCMVDLSTDGGSSWTSLRGGLGQAPSGSSGGWRLTLLDLSPWAGQAIKLRFYFDTIDAIANNYPGWFFDDVLVSATGVPWLTVTPMNGTIPEGTSQSLQARFDAAGLLGGDYDATIQIASNDPDEALVTVPAHLHVTSAPDIAVSPAGLDFGQIYAGASRSDSIAVSNRGTDVLTVSSIDVANPVFSAPAAGFTVAVGQTHAVVVTYAPTSVGASDGSLALHSDDPDEGTVILTLHGEAIEAPDVAVSPDSFHEVMPPDQVLTEILTIENRGGNPLIWTADAIIGAGAQLVEHQPAVSSSTPTELAAAAPQVAGAPPPRPDESRLMRWDQAAPGGASVGARPGPSRTGSAAQASEPPLSDVLALLETRHPSLTALIPNRFDFLEGESGVSITDGGQDMYDIGNFLQTDKGGPIPYSDGSIQTHPAFGNGAYFTRKYPGLFVLAANLQDVQSFIVSGNLGANGLGAVDGAVLDATGAGTYYRGYVKRVYGTGSASVNHLFILPEAGSTGHSYGLDTDSDFDQVDGLGTLGRLYYLLFAGNAGSYVDDQAMLDIMNAFLETKAPWVKVIPSSGTVPAHTSINLGVRFDSHNLPAGSYDGRVLVRSDDPDQPVVTVPVNLVVTGPVATEISLVSSSSGPGVVHLVWHATEAGAMTASVYRRTVESDWQRIGRIVPDGQGYMAFEDRDVVSGARYGYRLGIPGDGGLRFVAETWVEVPSGARLELHGMEPNPSVNDLSVAFSLPDTRPATLELLDLTGRRLRSQEVGARGAGRHVVSLGRAGSLPAGIYLVRLQRGDRALVAKCVVIR